MENFRDFTLSDEAKLAVENYFRKTIYPNPSEIYRMLCDAYEEILLVQQQEENTINTDSVVEVLGLYKELVEACLMDD